VLATHEIEFGETIDHTATEPQKSAHSCISTLRLSRTSLRR
jgi:hypothetical protein